MLSTEEYNTNANMIFSDIDECLHNTDGCIQDCVNSVGSFSCVCAAGFTGDGVTCTGEWLCLFRLQCVCSIFN